MEVEYTAKATSDITCIAETDPEQWTGDDPDVPVRVRGVREDGTVVVQGVIKLWVTEKPTPLTQPWETTASVAATDSAALLPLRDIRRSSQTASADTRLFIVM